MRRILFVVALMCPAQVWAASASNQPVACVAAKALADADGVDVPASTGTIAMETLRGTAKNQLTVVLSVTWGTTTAFQGYCEESTESTVWGRNQGCTDAYPAVCKPRSFQWSAADWADGKITWHLPIAAPFVRCRWWDAAAGSGLLTYCINRLDQ